MRCAGPLEAKAETRRASSVGSGAWTGVALPDDDDADADEKKRRMGPLDAVEE